MRTNTIVTLGASVIFGGLAVIMARGWINSAVESEFGQAPSHSEITLPQIELSSVVVADINLTFGDRLIPESLRIVDYPADAVPEGAFHSIDALFSDPERQALALGRIDMNEILLPHKVSGVGGRSSLSARIGDDMRAFAIRVNDVAGVGGFVLPGDHVDIILINPVESSLDAPIKNISQVLLQNIRVLGIDQNADDQTNNPTIASTVTIEVSTIDAQKLALAMETGRLSLSLRQAGSKDIVQTRQIASTEFANGTLRTEAKSQKRTQTKPKAPRKTQVTIIRGDESQLVNVVRDTKPKHAKLAGG